MYDAFTASIAGLASGIQQALIPSSLSVYIVAIWSNRDSKLRVTMPCRSWRLGLWDEREPSRQWVYRFFDDAREYIFWLFLVGLM